MAMKEIEKLPKVIDMIEVHEALKEGYVNIDDVIKRAKDIDKLFAEQEIEIRVTGLKKSLYTSYTVVFNELKKDGRRWVLTGLVQHFGRLEERLNIMASKSCYTKEEARLIWNELVEQNNWSVEEILSNIDWGVVDES